MHDAAAIAAHGFVGLRQQHAFPASVHRANQQRAVDQIDRGGRRMREAAGRHEKSPLGIGGDHGVMQPGDVARSSRGRPPDRARPDRLSPYAILAGLVYGWLCSIGIALLRAGRVKANVYPPIARTPMLITGSALLSIVSVIL